MTKDEFAKEQLRVSVTAGMNQRFHQDRALFWSKRSRIVEITVGFLAVAGLCTSVWALCVGGWFANSIAILLDALAATAAIILNVVHFSEFAADHRELFRRWTDLREDIDAMLYVAGDPQPHDVDRLREFAGKLHRICGSEVALNDEEAALFKKCEAAEKRSRPNCAPTREPVPS